MGTVYEATRQLDAALGMYEEALRLTPRNPAAYFYVGRALSRQNQLEKAEQILLKGLALDPKNPQLHMGLGHVLRAIGRNDEAMEAYEKAAREGDDEFVDAFRHIAMIHYKRLDHGKCKRYLKKYKRKGGTSPEADRMLQQLDK
jgi:tetratricopeptide (TPR) repeat protein